ncbi:hypothetical protein [Endozoicomonas montiporae]|uniref:hypothetical protein n=1 Tax=Endozoicomonas montiporae TaxID=1027273 RepID=UPI0011A3EB67|nr:hypothetical protein [Endozoicomonas montiporae]
MSRSSSIDSIKELYSDPFDTDFSGSDSETSVPFKTVSVKDDEQTMTVAMSAKRAQLLSELATGLSSDVDLSKEYEAMVNRVKSYSASSAILKQPDQWPEQEIISLCQEAIDYTRTQKLAEPTHSRDPRWPSLPSDEMTASDKTYIHEMVVGQNCYIA